MNLFFSQEYYKPIVTPFELEVALQVEQSWSGKYVLDFEKLLAEHEAGAPEYERNEAICSWH
jgi:diphthamide biosynthesis protein 2